MKMLNNKVWKNLSLTDWAILLCILVVTDVSYFRFGLALLLLAWLIDLFRKKISFKQFSVSTFLLLSIPFSLALLGLINTSNYAKAFEDISRLLPYCIFPLIFSTLQISPEKKILFIRTFVFSLSVLFCIAFYQSTIGYFDDYHIENYLYSYFITDTNTYSVFTLLSILFLSEIILHSKEKLFSKRNMYFTLILVFHSFCMLLLQSRFTILFTLIGLIFLFFLYIKVKNKWIVILPLFFIGGLLFLPVFNARYQVVANETKVFDKKNKQISYSNSQKDSLQSTRILTQKEKDSLQQVNRLSNCMSSTSLRLNALKSSFELIKENWIFGVGTGDWRDELTAHYEKKQRWCNAHEKTAPHNQYLRLGLKHGIIGLILMSVLFIRFIRNSFSKKELGKYSLLLTIFLSCMGYDVLDGGASLPTFALFISLVFLPTISIHSTNFSKDNNDNEV